MPLVHLYDRAGLLAASSLPLHPELRHLLAERVRHLDAHGLLDMSEIVVVDADTVVAEIVAAVGFDPLVDPDGNRYGDPAFASPIDYVAKVSRHYHEAIVCMGNAGFGMHLLVHDDAQPALVAFLRGIAT